MFIKESMAGIARAVLQAKELCGIQPTGRYMSQCQRMQQKLTVLIPFLETFHKDSTLAKASLPALGAMVLALSSAEDAFDALNESNTSSLKLSDESVAELVDEVCANVDLSLSKLGIIDKMDDFPLANADTNLEIRSLSSLAGMGEGISSGLQPPDTASVDEIRDEVTSTEFINQNGPPRTSTTAPHGLVAALKNDFAVESIGQKSGSGNDPEYVSDHEGAVQQPSGADPGAMDPVYVPTVEEYVPQMMDPVHVPSQEELELQCRFEEFLLSADVSTYEAREEAAHRALEQFERETIPILLKVISEGPVALRPLAAAVLRGAADISTVIGQDMVDAGAIPILIGPLSADDNLLQEHGAAILGDLAGEKAEFRQVIAEAGAVPLLVKLLGEGTIVVKERAAYALGNMAWMNAGNQKSIAREGAIPLLVQLLKEGAEDATFCAAASLSNLAADAENRKTIARAAAIPLLVQLLKEGTDATKQAAAVALGNLAVDVENKKTIAREGAIPVLVQLLRDGSEGAKEAAASALWSLAVDAENNETIARAGSIPVLVQLLREGTEGAKEAAAGALANLSEDASTAVQIYAEDAVSCLLKLLDGRNDTIRRLALRALCHLAHHHPPAKQEIGSKDTISILKDLSESGSELVRREARMLLNILL